jgi:hypothetical protein
MKPLGAALVVSVMVLVGLAGTAFAGTGGGNSLGAASCRQGGWSSLYRADGSGFHNTGDCVSYAAQGGALETQCQPGSWSSTGVTPCRPADVGFYVDLPGATSETPCPSGDTTSGTGSTSISDCVAAGPSLTLSIPGCDNAGGIDLQEAWSGFTGRMFVATVLDGPGGNGFFAFTSTSPSDSQVFDIGTGWDEVVVEAFPCAANPCSMSGTPSAKATIDPTAEETVCGGA